MELRVNFIDVSFSQVMEGIICDKKYGDVTDPLKDTRCKSEAVQAELSLIFGIGVSCQLVPEILTSVFYGRLSDKYGRRLVLFLSCLGSLIAALAQLTICELFGFALANYCMTRANCFAFSFVS